MSFVFGGIWGTFKPGDNFFVLFVGADKTTGGYETTKLPTLPRGGWGLM